MFFVSDHYQSQNGIEENSDEETGGIEFTARGSDGDVTDSKEYMSPVALECQLPWKRAESVETGPLSSMATHLLPNDSKPELSQVPSWADNLEYSHIPTMSPRPQNGQLNSSNNNSSSNLNGGVGVELPANGRSVPLVPTIKIDSPGSSANNLLSTTNPFYTSNGAPSMNGGVTFTAGSDDSSGSELTIPSPTSDSEDDEEVEIRPFGKISMSTKGSQPQLSHRRSPPLKGDSVEVDERNGQAVQFSINNDESSDEETSSF